MLQRQYRGCRTNCYSPIACFSLFQCCCLDANKTQNSSPVMKAPPTLNPKPQELIRLDPDLELDHPFNIAAGSRAEFKDLKGLGFRGLRFRA